MNKIVILRVIQIVNFLVFLYALCANDFFELEFSEIWFFLALFLISIPFLVKSYLFYVDASMYLGCTLLFCSMVGFLSNIFLLDLSLVYPWYIFSLAFASFMVYLIFRQNIHFILFAIISIEVLILLLRKLAIFSSTVFYVLNACYLIILFMLFMSRVSKSSRRV